MDAKLARSAKARAVLQASFYSHLLAGVQKVEPRWMHLALGNGEFASFKVDDFAAYERQTRRLLAAAIGGDPAGEVYPEPVEHCAICRWRELCADRRRNDDDLSLVAGMTTGQRRALKGAGISTRRGFAALAELPQVDRVSPDVLRSAQWQARLQVATEDDGVIRYEILDPERDGDGGLVTNRGLLALPEPADGDLFFDIEGARYYSEDGREFGLQYLFGVVDTAEVDEAGLPRYTQIWAFDRPGEKRAFEELIDFITERRARHPGLHVYHYNHYEPTSVDHLTELHGTRQEAVGALMGRFATREDEVDDLFRLGVFTDLYRVVRQGARAGVENYSIKRLEPLCGYDRRVDLAEATRGLIALEAALEDGTAAGDGERQRVVAGYNEDDCRATLALRNWLEERRIELAERLGQELPRPAFAEKPAAAGLLLDQTWRMHPDLCRYTSAAFYDGKLAGVDGLGRQEILGWSSGLRLVEVPHQGNTNASPEEAREVARLAEQPTGRTWRDKNGTERSMEPTDILIVTPYNAQIRAIQRALTANGQAGFRVGTVDKFQGQEAPVVIYSMATSSADEAPRGLEFLYDPHRLNVATSRARALAIIVASPDLIRVSCRTPQQIVLANALCRAWETGG